MPSGVRLYSPDRPAGELIATNTGGLAMLVKAAQAAMVEMDRLAQAEAKIRAAFRLERRNRRRSGEEAATGYGVRARNLARSRWASESGAKAERRKYRQRQKARRGWRPGR